MTKLQDFLNSSVGDVTPMNVRVKPGDLFGVELECEGTNVDWDGVNDDIMRDWSPHRDGSLRNNHGQACEWVFKSPVPYAKAIERVDHLFNYFERRKAKLVCSNRTSTHVHFNMGDKKAYQVVNMFILFTILEDLLDNYCGEDRRGNLFCLSSRHAEEQIRWMEQACFQKFRFNFSDNNRYCSLNLAALNKFGSVEFRAMRGLDNREDLLEWLEIINEFCDYACYKMKNPVTLIEEISLKTPLGFIKQVFSQKNAMKLTHGLNERIINQSVYDGLRLVQMLSYRIGTEFDQVKLSGKDFWASFQNDAPPMDEIEEGPRVNPFEQQYVNPGQLVRMDQLDGRGVGFLRPDRPMRINVPEGLDIIGAGYRAEQAIRNQELAAWVALALPHEPLQHAEPLGNALDAWDINNPPEERNNEDALDF